jgi:hypothetical protein
MTRIDKEKIIGKWENDIISYVFDKDGLLHINWIKDKLVGSGLWSIENDEIIIKHGENLHQTWKGKINHITDNELSITDLSNQIGTIDLLYKKELPPTTEKKNFKEKLTETVWGVLGIAFMTAFFGGMFYVIYRYGFKYQSHEYNYFFIGMILFMISAGLLIISLYKVSEPNILLIKGYFIFYASVIALPVLYFVFALIFILITYWYYLLLIAFVITLFVLLVKERDWIFKSIIILISVASMYFLYDAKSILKIKFEVKFDNKIIGAPDDEEEPQ